MAASDRLQRRPLYDTRQLVQGLHSRVRCISDARRKASASLWKGYGMNGGILANDRTRAREGINLTI